MRPLLAALLLLTATAVHASVTVRRTPGSKTKIDVEAAAAPLSVVAKALEPYVGRAIVVDMLSDPVMDYRASGVVPADALRAIARAAALTLSDEGSLVLRDPKEPTVTMDVKDEEVREILKSIKTQCAIRNLIVDPGVKGTATFVFHAVPCHTALSTVLATFGLAAVVDGRSVVSVEPRQR
jgi:type II secretory pathway component GspD/PulD (secretin)